MNSKGKLDFFIFIIISWIKLISFSKNTCRFSQNQKVLVKKAIETRKKKTKKHIIGSVPPLKRKFTVSKGKNSIFFFFFFFWIKLNKNQN